LLAALSEHINKHFSFLKNKKLLIAISGGIDSVVLTYLLQQLKFDISLAHCNFHLRGEDSDNDEKLVLQIADHFQLPIFKKSFETSNYAKKERLSIQLAARNLRYKWFDVIVKENKLDYILTGHHADDNLETFLINAIRGTGLDGLTGIPEKNQNIIRLLLPFTREQIKKYAKENAIIWREDTSNMETKYVRNKIRHQVIPTLQELNPSLLSSFQKTLRNLKESRQIIDDTIQRVKNHSVSTTEDGMIKIDINKLKDYNNPKAYIYELLKGYGFTEWNDITDLLEAQSGKQILSNRHRLVKNRNFLLLTNLNDKKPEDMHRVFEIDKKDEICLGEDFELRLSRIEQAKIKGKSKDIVFIDNDKLNFPLTVRKWKNGDYFYPSGMQGKKKLSKFFIDNKMSIIQKEKIWLLCSANEVVWIIGERLDDRFKAVDKTKNILKIETV